MKEDNVGAKNYNSGLNSNETKEITSFVNRLVILFLGSSVLPSIVRTILRYKIRNSFFDDFSGILMECLSLLIVLVFGSHLFKTTSQRIAFSENTLVKLPVIDSILLTVAFFSFEWIIIVCVFLFANGNAGFASSVISDYTIDHLVMVIIASCILGPIYEEILFRKIGFQYAQNYGTMFAIVTSTIVFAVAHGFRLNFISAIFMGLFLGILYAQTGRVICPILFHVFHNGFYSALEFIFPPTKGLIPDFALLLLLCVFILLCVISSCFYISLRKICLQDVSIKIIIRNLWMRLKADKDKYKAYFLSGGAGALLGYMLASVLI